MDRTTLRKIIEGSLLRYEDGEFQDFSDRLGFTMFPDDYTSVRAGGPRGDDKNDGYCPKARLFMQAHATRGETISDTKRKIRNDFEGCIRLHSDVKVWRYLTNDTLVGEVQTFIDEEIRPLYKNITIETWDYKKLADEISSLNEKKIEYILELNFYKDKEYLVEMPTVDVSPEIGYSGSTEGQFHYFNLQNISKFTALGIDWGIIGKSYEWNPPIEYLNKTLLANEKIENLPYPLSQERTSREKLMDLKLFIKYTDEKGNIMSTYRDLEQEKLSSDSFYTLKLGKFHPAEIVFKSRGSGRTTQKEPKKNNLETFENFIVCSSWRKEYVDEQLFWVCEDDNLYQIEHCNNYGDFTEKWTQVYPDRLGSGKYSINLRINGVVIKQITFIYCDGGRISVPLPELKAKDDTLGYVWNKDSLEFKIGELIGSFYIYGNMEGVASMSKIDIVTNS